MKKEKILLMLLPFWDPQIPPTGMACLKSFLQAHGYPIKAVDANIEAQLKQIYIDYFDTLKKYVMESHLGNFNKAGYDILHNHMMAYLHKEDETLYYEAIQTLIKTSFFVDFNREQILALNQLIIEFFQNVETYIRQILEVEKPDVLGITVYTDTLPASILAFKLAKEMFPQIKTVMGGGIFCSDMAVGTSNMEHFLAKVPYVDKVLVGEGENLFLQFLQGKLDDKPRVVQLKDIENSIMDISTALLPDFSDFQLGHYPYLASYTSRSCPFQCEFCTETVFWGKYRKKNATQVAEELISLYRQYDFQLFFMSDSLLNPIIQDMSCELVKKETSVYFDGFLRADRIACDTANTLQWRRAGFYRARMGLESGSQKVLDAMNKKITVQLIKDTVSALAYAGIKTTTYWIMGFPGETEEDFQQTLDLIEEMADDIYEVNCSPFWFFQDAQGGSPQWKDKSMPLFPEKAREMFVMQTWTVDCEPSREEIYHRIWRFTEHCKKFGIPNPYTLKEFHDADLRWAELQKNAVPSLVWFGNKKHYIDENKKIKEPVTAQYDEVEDGDFGF